VRSSERLFSKLVNYHSKAAFHFITPQYWKSPEIEQKIFCPHQCLEIPETRVEMAGESRKTVVAAQKRVRLIA
jgi:hypothetical protein